MKQKYQTIEKAFKGRCPKIGNICINPACIFGCIWGW